MYSFFDLPNKKFLYYFMLRVTNYKYNNVNIVIHMAITEWHTPIHECQKGEVQREWCYLEPYYFFNGNLKDYSKLLK
jgi:hypothetical protein